MCQGINGVHCYSGISGQDSGLYTYSDTDTAGPFTYRNHCAVESNCNPWKRSWEIELVFPTTCAAFVQ